MSIFFYNSSNSRLLNPSNLLSSSNTSPISHSRILEEDIALVFNYLHKSICC